jgi:FAD/FMN-containing dehydrogenase
MRPPATFRARSDVAVRDSSGFAAGARGLEAALRRAGAGEVRFDDGSRALYATDSSNDRQVPVGVVLPRDAGDVTRTLDVARRHGAALLGRGCGTSLAGQACNAAIVFDFSKYMHRIVEIDPAEGTARVQPGIVLDRLREAAAPHGLTFGPDPATHAYCTLGGMIGNNSCGVHSVLAEFHGPGPTTADSLEALEIVTADGTRLRVGPTDDREYDRIVSGGGRAAEIYRRLLDFQQRHAATIRREFPDIPRRVSGYNLPALLPENGFHVARALAGSESTLALTLEATVRLMPALPHRLFVVLGFDDVFAAADHVPRVRAYRPVALEGMDEGLADDVRRAGLDARSLDLLPDGRGWLLVEFGGESPEAARDQAFDFADDMRRASDSRGIRLFEAAADQHRLLPASRSSASSRAASACSATSWRISSPSRNRQDG